VLGNHEFWHGELRERRDEARRVAKTLGITLLDDSEAEVAGLSFVGGTLWRDDGLGQPIMLGERRMTRSDAAVLHARTVGVIEAAMARPRQGRLVVVTHHAPRVSALTDCGQAAIWVHGDVHEVRDETRPGGTRMVCNAAGPGFTNLAFRDDWVVEV